MFGQSPLRSSTQPSNSTVSGEGVGGGGVGGGGGGGDGGGGAGAGGFGDPAAACRAVKVLPATVTVPSRATPELAATWTLTVPVAFPDAPFEIVSQGALLAAVQAQPLTVVTPIATAPAAAPIEASAGAIAYEQGAAAWLTGS